MAVKHLEWFKAGAILGAFLYFVMPIVNSIVGSATYGVTFSVYNIRGSLAAFSESGSAFAQYLLQLAGLQWSLPALLIVVIGTGGLVILARFITGLLKVPAKHMLVGTLALAAVLEGLIVAGGFNQIVGIFSIEFVIFAGLTGFVLALLIKNLYKSVFKMPLPA